MWHGRWADGGALKVPRYVIILGHERRRLRVPAPPIFDLDRVAGRELAGELDQLLPGSGLVLVLGFHACEPRPVELRDDVPGLEPRLLGRSARGHRFELGAELVALGRGVR